MEKSPMTSLFARCLRCLSSAYMLEQPEICEKFSEKILEKLVSYKKILAKDADAAKLEYSNFLTKIVKANKSDFVKFNKSSVRADLFFGKYINTSEYEQMWCVFKLLLCLSHGQASVERGFSVNSNLLVENMHEDSLIAQRIVHDHVKSLKLEAYEVKVTKTCLDNANSARRRYFDALKQKSVSNQRSERQTKIDSINEEINLVNQKISLLETTINYTRKNADTLAEKALMRTTFAEMKSSLSQSNVLKRAANEKQEELDKQLEKKKVLLKKSKALN